MKLKKKTRFEIFKKILKNFKDQNEKKKNIIKLFIMPKPFVCDHCKKKKKSIPYVLHGKATLNLSGWRWRYTGPFTVHGWPTDHTREMFFYHLFI
jgi:hypothetical protein